MNKKVVANGAAPGLSEGECVAAAASDLIVSHMVA